MRVAAFQFDVRRGDVQSNLATVEAGLRRAARAGLQLVVLPEMWPTSFIDVAEVDEAWLGATEQALEHLRALTAELGLIACGSAFGRAAAREWPRNRLHVFERGQRVLAYDKVHLFSPTAEPESFSAGDAPPATVRTGIGSLSGIVCYDLRFGPLVRRTWLDGAEILCVSAQWPEQRSTHWRALVVGRAVECQAFVVAANRIGQDLIGRRRMELAFPGNSLIVDPHGHVLAEGRGEEGLVEAEVELQRMRDLRVRVPIQKDQRPDLYRAWEQERVSR
jgi:predicted amidohydrolase